MIRMFRHAATILVAILLSSPLVAEITPFPASFHTQMVPTNGTRPLRPSRRQGSRRGAVAWLRLYG
jgi:hypothetical protein